ncbi:DUF6544 family protein [Wenzhouxiangella marina]|uniref:Uncharacterized protein n=1 Tax=Wenzhouxiangella marina TaxID=1579979 RepID=A0A0K0XV63_9GAMM|nr:DUF6544 family protein [Wenzhouxiangella marina]AKS41555.1 hypothetical protein WM2015_1181 [Wenzhouxiangella marina]MBB6086686.1 hypothetical protein [Wenzhouxiangella marina]
MTMLSVASIILFLGAMAMVLLRIKDQRADDGEWRRLALFQPQAPAAFEPACLAALPEPARRYFAYTIQPGTPLLPVAEIQMRGQFSLGTKEAPNYLPMEARQILASPHGFVWAMRTRGGMPISGSDSGRWTRFRILGVIPVARLGGDPDHTRSAFGRYVAEAVFWTPAALLPSPGVDWQAVDQDTARVTIRHGSLEQSVDVTVDSEGRPVQVLFQRWSNANPDRTHRLQPFGGRMSDFREVEGYRLPFRVEAGNFFGTDDYFPFFLAEVTAIRFPQVS